MRAGCVRAGAPAGCAGHAAPCPPVPAAGAAPRPAAAAAAPSPPSCICSLPLSSASYVKMEVNGFPLKAFIDSGAQVGTNLLQQAATPSWALIGTARRGARCCVRKRHTSPAPQAWCIWNLEMRPPPRATHNAPLRCRHLPAALSPNPQMTIMSRSCAERCNLLRLMDKRFAGMAVGVGSAKILGGCTCLVGHAGWGAAGVELGLGQRVYSTLDWQTNVWHAARGSYPRTQRHHPLHRQDPHGAAQGRLLLLPLLHHRAGPGKAAVLYEY